jgi:hypothetical protein
MIIFVEEHDDDLTKLLHEAVKFVFEKQMFVVNT